MRILYVSHTHPPKDALLDNIGGMQRVSYQLIQALHNRNDIVLKTETINAAGRGLVALQTTWFLLKLLFVLPYKARKFDADVIVFSSMVTASLAWFLKDRVNIPLVTINHGRDVTLSVSIYQWFVPRVLSALDGIISVSSATRKQCIQRGMDPQKGVALPNGIDTDNVNLPDKKSARAALHKKFGMEFDDHKMLLSVGRKVKRKGDEWFIRKVLPKIETEVLYVTVGDGPELEHIRAAAVRSTLKDKIFVVGRQSEHVLRQTYAAADLFIMPNIPVEGDMEGFGIVLLEANMAETPAVAADLEGIKDVITNGKNGYKVPPLDEQKFSQTIDGIFKNDLNHLSVNCRIHAKNRFGWHQVAGQYVEFFKQVIERYQEKTEH